jgi:hypothetical protein
VHLRDHTELVGSLRASWQHSCVRCTSEQSRRRPAQRDPRGCIDRTRREGRTRRSYVTIGVVLSGHDGGESLATSTRERRDTCRRGYSLLGEESFVEVW